MPPEITELQGLTHAEFLASHARAGRVGLAGSKELVSRIIRRVQRHSRPDGKASLWSHAFIFTGERLDGRHWVLESDLDFDLRHKTVRLGVQENRVEKYHSHEEHPHLAVLDFGLTETETQQVVVEGLHLLAGHTVYSLRELVGTMISMTRPRLRVRENLLAQEGALYCSAMVHHCFHSAGVTLRKGLHDKNVTPDDLIRSPRLKSAWVLKPAL